MTYLEITGNQKLSGDVKISGAKNSALPLLASTILSKNVVKITNMPLVVDVRTLLKLLGNLGASYEFSNSDVTIDSTSINSTKANYDIVRQMRASILVLGPLLARFGHCEVSLPGGCAIGQRPIDLHLKALKLMGAKIEIKEGYILATAKNGLQGAHILFDKVTVTGTANILMAAALANGKTIIVNAAIEPEVVQMCEVLSDAGTKITGIGTRTLEIIGSGGKLIDMQDIEVIPDRIEAGTYLCAGAITNSKISVTNVNPDDLDATITKLREMGFGFDIDKKNVTILPAKEIGCVNIQTGEHPGFPTDMQAQFMALALFAKGTSTINERLFENRFMHVSELKRMGANITLNSTIATIYGNGGLIGADVMATDLRASSALILAGLVADGVTKVHRIYHLDRGYEKLEEKLTKLGAKVKRLKE